MSKLKQAVRDMHDDDELRNIAQNGCSGGTSLTYYHETTAFYNEHVEDIWELAYQQADEIGYKHVLEMFASFQGAKDIGCDYEFKNMLAWYAIEEMAKLILEEQEETQCT